MSPTVSSVLVEHGGWSTGVEDTSGVASPRVPRWAVRLGFALLGMQLCAMVVFSTYQYDHFAETTDFATYTQAWTAIAHGNLNPFSTTLGTSFWRNNTDFVMWPMALLYWLHPHPDALLWIQDLAVAATDMVVLGWVTRILQGSSLADRWRGALCLSAAIILAFDPWAWNTIAFDLGAAPLE